MHALSGDSVKMPLLIWRIKEMFKEKGIKKTGEQFFNINLQQRTQTKTINAWYECSLTVESVNRGIWPNQITLLDDPKGTPRMNSPHRKQWGILLTNMSSLLY